MIFLDTCYFKALMDDTDLHHDDALRIENYIDDFNENTVINTTVLVETLNWSVGTDDNVEYLYNDLNSQNHVVQLTDEDYLKSVMINGWYGNSINYSDCTIITTMMNMGIHRIVSFDGDFKKIKGYQVISSI